MPPATTAAPQLTHTQLIANINAMEKQGAKPDEVQGYLDSLKPDQGGGAASSGVASPQTLDQTLSDMPGPLGQVGSGIYNAVKFVGKGAYDVGKDVVGAVAHPLDTAGKIESFVNSEGANNTNPASLDTVGQIAQNTLGSKGAMGLGREVGSVAVGQPHWGALAGTALNTGLGVGGALVGAPASFFGRAGAGSVIGGGLQVGSNLQEGRPVMENVLKSATTGAAVPGIVEGAGALAKNLPTGTGNLGTNVLAKLSGTELSTLKTAAQFPEQFGKQARSLIDRPSIAAEVKGALDQRYSALADTGKEYTPIRESTTPVRVQPDFIDNLIQKNTGVSIEDGKITTSGSAEIRNPTEVRALQNLYDTYKPIFENGKMSPNELLNFRSDLDNLSKFERQIGKSAPLENVAKLMRHGLNDEYRSQVPGLRDLDTRFAPQLADMNRLEKGILDRNGNLTDAAINKIANATGKGKDILLSKLEETVPGITQKIKVLKAIEDLQNIHKVGTYTKSTLGAGTMIAGATTGNIPLMAGALAEMIITSPENAVKIMRGVGYGRQLYSAVIDKLKGGQSPKSTTGETMGGSPQPETQSPPEQGQSPNPQTTLPQAQSIEARPQTNFGQGTNTSSQTPSPTNFGKPSPMTDVRRSVTGNEPITLNALPEQTRVMPRAAEMQDVNMGNRRGNADLTNAKLPQTNFGKAPIAPVAPPAEPPITISPRIAEGQDINVIPRGKTITLQPKPPAPINENAQYVVGKNVQYELPKTVPQATKPVNTKLSTPTTPPVDFKAIEPFMKLGKRAAEKAGVLDEYTRAMDLLKKEQGAIPETTMAKELQPLAQEAQTYYHGSNKALTKAGLDYGTFLTTNKQEAIDYANMRSGGRGGKPVISELKLNPDEVRLNTGTGEYQYIGKTKNLSGGKYPETIYKALNDAEGSNMTRKEIDAIPLDELRARTSMGLEGGKEEFDQLIGNVLTKSQLTDLYNQATKK